MGAPLVKVEISQSAPTGTQTWVDETAYVRADIGISITHGRADEEAEVGPGRLTLTLDNSSGRFTYAPAGTPPRWPGQRIRVSAWDGSAWVPRFHGTVDGWPVSWDGDSPLVQIGATDLLKLYQRLALNLTLGGMFDEYRTIERRYGATLSILPWAPDSATGPTTTWTIGGSNYASTLWSAYTADAIVSDTAPGATVARLVDVGTTSDQDAGLGDMTKVRQWEIAGATGAWLASGSSSTRIVSTWVRLPAATSGVVTFGDTATTGLAYFAFTRPALVIAAGIPLLSVQTGPVASPTPAWSSFPSDGWHHLAIARNASTYLDYYVDGVKVYTGAVAAWPNRGLSVTAGNPISWQVAHTVTVDISAATDNDAIVTGLYRAGVGDVVGETAQARIGKALDRIGWATADRDLSATTRILAPSLAKPLAVTQVVTDAIRGDGGIFYATPDGRLALRPSSAKGPATVSLTVDAADVGPDFAVDVDDSQLENKRVYTRTDSAGTVLQQLTLTNDASVAQHGENVGSGVGLPVSAEDFPAVAGEHFAKRSSVKPRARSLTLDPLTSSSSILADALALQIWDRVQVTNLPSGAGFTSIALFVEGWQESLSVDKWELKLTTSPAFTGTAAQFGTAKFGTVAKFA